MFGVCDTCAGDMMVGGNLKGKDHSYEFERTRFSRGTVCLCMW
jgi:hypothetical protein